MMELPPEKVQNNDNMLLLRRPRPPKSNSLDLSPSKTASSLSRRHTTGVSLTSDHSGSQVVRDFRKSLTPLLDKNLYKADVEERLQELSHFMTVPKGPKFFPPGRVFHSESYPSMLLDLLPDEIHLAEPEHDFSLNDFRLPPPPPHHPHLQVSHGTVSRENYLKLTGWFAKHVPTQESVNTLEMSVDHQAPPDRVPRAQIFIGKCIATFPSYFKQYSQSEGVLGHA